MPDIPSNHDSRNTPRVADATLEAVRYVLRHHGLNYSDPDWLFSRLARCSQAQITELQTGVSQKVRDLVLRFRR